MQPDRLKVLEQPKLPGGRAVLAFSGWMDGGEVSTGTVEWLVKTLRARSVATIDPEGFCLFNMPGSMEVAALFRPYTKIEDGVLDAYEPPDSTFYSDEQHRLLMFRSREPNLGWREFADCLFRFASQCGVSELYFVGSVGGAVPHTREPRIRSAVSDPSLKPSLERYGVNFVTYEGPASFSTYLLAQAPTRGFTMASLVVEIPAYIQGTNPKCIEAVIRKLDAILELKVDLDELRALVSAWDERLSGVLEEDAELAKFIHKLEEDYDNEVFDTQMGDLKQWLEQRGVRVD
jgi:predicted ATP-grasp superfamily ATP-dependent carboligase